MTIRWLSEPGSSRDRKGLLLEESVRPKTNWVQVKHSQLWPQTPMASMDACGFQGTLRAFSPFVVHAFPGLLVLHPRGCSEGDGVAGYLRSLR